MNEKQLRYFINIAELGSYSKAANMLFVSQQALSKSIKNLENEFGSPLFYKSANGIALTYLGEKLYPRAKMLTGNFDRLAKDIKDWIQTNESTFSLALSQNAPFSLPMWQISDYEQQQGIIIEKHFPLGYDYAEQARNYIVDLSYGSKPADLTELTYIPRINESQVVLMNKQHALAGREELSLDELQNEQFAFLKCDDAAKISFIHACLKLGFTPKIAYESPNAQILISFVEQNKCIKLLPKYALPAFQTQNMVSITLKPCGYMTELGFIYNSARGIKKSAQNFIDYFLLKEPTQ